jgi:hypothetical protein
MLLPIASAGLVVISMVAAQVEDGRPLRPQTAQPAAPRASTSELPEALQRRKDPFAGVFTGLTPSTPILIDVAPRLPPEPPDAPRVVCGIIVIPASPDVDPGIVRAVPPSDVEFAIRRVTPEPCEK